MKPVQRRRAFTIVELMVALLIASIGLAGILRLFVETARTAHRAERRAVAHALGTGLIVEWQAMKRAEIARTLGEGQQTWPGEPQQFESTVESARPLAWQWRWEDDLDLSAPLHLELHISSDWDDPGETIRISATL